jgi:hypothetical protein
MPTQNAAVAIAFWTFLFWYFSDRWPAHADGERHPSRRGNGAAGGSSSSFAIGTLTQPDSLRVPMRAGRVAGTTVYGFHDNRAHAGAASVPADGSTAVAVVRAFSPMVKLVGVGHASGRRTHPVLGACGTTTLVSRNRARDNIRCHHVIIDRDPRMLMVRTYSTNGAGMAARPRPGTFQMDQFARHTADALGSARCA